MIEGTCMHLVQTGGGGFEKGCGREGNGEGASKVRREGEVEFRSVAFIGLIINIKLGSPAAIAI